MVSAEGIARQDAAWVAGRLAFVPGPWRDRAAGQYAERIAEKKVTPAGRGLHTSIDHAANTWLIELADRFGGLRVSPGLSDAELCERAAECAKKAFSLAECAPGVFLSDSRAIRNRMAAYVSGFGIPCPALPDGNGGGIDDGPAIARMTDELWWRRGLRVAQARALEGHAIGLGFVHRDGEIYASDATVKRRAEQRARNAATLANTMAINTDSGEVFALADLADRSVANPRIRRGELMTRIAGFEAVAKGLDHAAEFVTLTCPSAYHAKRIGSGGKAEDNPAWNGKTPREAQGYLSKVWARIRAKLGRMGLMPYGFRIVEPHHDGTPHWHMLLFVDRWLTPGRAAVGRLRAIIRRYALREAADEPGARRYRCEFKAIDWARGSAAGYVAKYVSKNIDGGGYEVQGDIEGHDAIVPSQRVEAWASTWGIRQFQQVGGPPVGVWRELRRLDAAGEYTDTVEAARSAADCGTKNGHDETGAAGNWRRYVEIQGGPCTPRKNLAMRTAYTRPGERYDYRKSECYPAELTRYGEVAGGVVYGVRDCAADRAFPGVRDRWEVRRGSKDWAGMGQAGALVRQGLGAVQGGGGFGASAVAQSVGGEGVGVGFGGARTRVNNCTRGIERWNPPAWTAAEIETLESWERLKSGTIEHDGAGGDDEVESSWRADRGRGVSAGVGAGNHFRFGGIGRRHGGRA